ncbi:MAG: hypothetical protein IJ706_05360, partial [Clostridia bacterium]|nr:hypothetical protein [Clostridia bacterium]
ISRKDEKYYRTSIFDKAVFYTLYQNLTLFANTSLFVSVAAAQGRLPLWSPQNAMLAFCLERIGVNDALCRLL